MQKNGLHATRNLAGSNGARRTPTPSPGRMTMMVRASLSIFVRLALLGCASLVPGAASAQDWPSKSVRIVTGFAAGVEKQ